MVKVRQEERKETVNKKKEIYDDGDHDENKKGRNERAGEKG